MYSLDGVLFPGQSSAHFLGIGPSAAVPRNWSVTTKWLTIRPSNGSIVKPLRAL